MEKQHFGGRLFLVASPTLAQGVQDGAGVCQRMPLQYFFSEEPGAVLRAVCVGYRL
jgi:hypothetical protein